MLGARYGLAVLALSCASYSGLCATNYVEWRLESPVLSNGVVNLTLHAEAGVSYVIESSSNLQTWTPIATNGDAQITRTIGLDSAADAGFFRVGRQPLPVFGAALATVDGIDFNGKNVETDSFDSADPLFSDNGFYPADQPERQKDNGHVITDFYPINSLAVGGQRIKGMVRTGLGFSFSIGTNTSVGDKDWVEAGTLGIQPGHFEDNMNVVFNPVKLPFTSWYAVAYYSAGFTNDGAVYNWVINGNGDYYVSDLSKSLLVTGNVRLLVTTRVSLIGANDHICISPGSSLEIYAYCATASIGGLGIVNRAGNATNFSYFGLATNTKISLAGNVDFTGVVYAPQAAFTIGGGGSDTYDFVGASVTKSVKLNGHYRFHFDENLLRAGPVR